MNLAQELAAPIRRSDVLTVVVADPIHSVGIDRMRSSFDVTLLRECGSERERAAALSRADALVVRTFETRDAVMDRAPRLKLIAKHGSGVDNIDISAASARGILVANTPGGANSSSVAEGAVALMLAVLRRTRDMDACVRENRFQDRWSLELHDLWEKHLGLVGFGQIARVVARICGTGFGMRVSAFDPFVTAEAMSASGVQKIATLAELMAAAEVVSVHAPLSTATHHLVDRAALAAMKPSAIVVNTSRGGVVDESALIDALRERRIAGAGLDVFEREPPVSDNPLFAMPNVVLSPHVAGVTQDSLRGMASNVAEVVENVFSGRRPSTLLNPEIWETRRT
jgi:D-3-phosphoglycerate dehydrogenase / 2-oxoglutarate reductase